MSDVILPDLQACLLCEDVRAELSGQQTLVGVITAIPAPQLPVAFFKLCLWSRWVGGEGRFTQRSIVISAETEKVMAEAKVDFELNGMDHHATNVHVFGGVRFESYGIHYIEVHLDDELRLRFPLPVVKVQQR